VLRHNVRGRPRGRSSAHELEKYGLELRPRETFGEAFERLRAHALPDPLAIAHAASYHSGGAPRRRELGPLGV
jgi:hypothetical protein